MGVEGGSGGRGYMYTHGFLDGSAGKESACNAGDLGLIPGLGRSPGEGKGYPFQYCALENSIAESWTRLSDLHFTWLIRVVQQKLKNVVKQLYSN